MTLGRVNFAQNFAQNLIRPPACDGIENLGGYHDLIGRMRRDEVVQAQGNFSPVPHDGAAQHALQHIGEARFQRFLITGFGWRQLTRMAGAQIDKGLLQGREKQSRFLAGFGREHI